MNTALFHSLAYTDAHAAIEFLSKGLGFTVAAIYADPADDRRVLHEQALAHGAAQVRPPADMDYGGRGSTVADPEGNEWSIGSFPGE